MKESIAVSFPCETVVLWSTIYQDSLEKLRNHHFHAATRESHAHNMLGS